MFFGAEITGIGIFRHLKTLIRKQPLVVFRPILCKRSLVHFHGLCGNGELDCHRIGVSHIQCLLILYHVTVFEHQFLHFGILIRFLEDDVSVYRLVLLEHFIQHNGIGSRFDFHIDCATINVRCRTTFGVHITIELDSPVQYINLLAELI